MPNNKFSILDSVLTDQEKAALQLAADNPVMFSALKKVVLCSVYYNGTLREGMDPNPTINAALAVAMNNTAAVTNEQLGADLRGVTEGVRLVELGFNQLGTYKSAPKEPKQKAKSGR